MCLFCIFFPLSFVRQHRYPPLKTEKVYSKIHHNISNDKILNSF